MKCEVLIDWLTFTVKETDPEMVIRDYLGMDPDLFQQTGLSLMGYQSVRAFSDIRVCSQPRENEYFHNMGVCVSMSGNGCRSFETFSRLAGVPDRQEGESAVFLSLFQKLVTGETVHITRLDIACDDRDGALDMTKIMGCVNSGAVNSRLSRRTVEYEMNGSQRGGATVYIGAPSSDYRIRIYDKAAEQGVAGQCH